MEPTSEIKKAIEDKKLVIGTKETIKKLKHGEIMKVFLSANCPESVKDDIHHLCSMAQIPSVDLEFPNTELGIVCKKPFSISLVSVARGAGD